MIFCDYFEKKKNLQIYFLIYFFKSVIILDKVYYKQMSKINVRIVGVKMEKGKDFTEIERIAERERYVKRSLRISLSILIIGIVGLIPGIYLTNYCLNVDPHSQACTHKILWETGTTWLVLLIVFGLFILVSIASLIRTIVARNALRKEKMID